MLARRRSPRVGERQLLLGATRCIATTVRGTCREDYRKGNGVLRAMRRATATRRLRVTLLGYDARWNATDQIPQRAVDSGLIGRFGSLDPTSGGNTRALQPVGG